MNSAISSRRGRAFSALFVACLLASNSAFAPANDDAQSVFKLTLKDSTILSLIEIVSQQTGKNFVVDPKVSGKLTVISGALVDADELYGVFLSILQVHGFSAIPVGDIVKIVPDSKGKEGSVPVTGDITVPGDQLVRRVVSIQNVPAAQLVPILRPMVPQNGLLAANAASNSLIITDRASNIERLLDIVRLVDKPDSNEVEVVSVKFALASDIVQTLSPLQRLGGGDSAGPNLMQLFADYRSNSVMISGSRAVRNRIRKLIEGLDQPMRSIGGNTRVISLRFAKAADLMEILRGTFEFRAESSSVFERYSNESETINDVDDPDLEPSSRPLSQNSSDASGVNIQTDSQTNSLVVTAPPDDMQSILAIIEQLDVRRPQVLVRAVIAEVTEDNLRELGINVLLDGSTATGISNLGNTLNSFNSGSGSGEGVESGLSVALGNFNGGNIDFGMLFKAIASDADNNILSTPTIVTLDNEEAEIIVGSNVPFITGQQLSDNNSNPFQTVERADVGLTLRVTPQISDDDTIKLVLAQEVSSLDTTAVTGAADITTSRRSISTTVLVEDGQTLILGGLIDEKKSEVVEKVPLLGDIPVVGNLFRYRSTMKTKRNLMIFLRPMILRNAEDARRASETNHGQLSQEQVRTHLEVGEKRRSHPAHKSPRKIPVIRENEWVEQPDGSFSLIGQ